LKLSQLKTEIGNGNAFDWYRRLAGEIEARDTAARGELPRAQRGAAEFAKASRRANENQQIAQEYWTAARQRDPDASITQSPSYGRLQENEVWLRERDYDGLGREAQRALLAGDREAFARLAVRPYLEAGLENIRCEDVIVRTGGASVAAMAESESQQVLALMERFQKELDREKLTAEQRGIYDVMIGQRGETEVRKSDLGALRGYVLLERGGIKRGAKHVLIKHYSGYAGPVTAQEVVDMGQVIRLGNVNRDKGSERQTVYEYRARRRGTLAGYGGQNQ